jgi:hypothetical protein
VLEEGEPLELVVRGERHRLTPGCTLELATPGSERPLANGQPAPDASSGITLLERART